MSDPRSDAHEFIRMIPQARALGIVVNRMRGTLAEHKYRFAEIAAAYPELLIEPAIPERSLIQRAEGAGVPFRALGRPGAGVGQIFDRAFTEVYTALQTGAVDGQDNPLPTVVDAKFYEVTKQIVLTSHLVDLNYIALSKAAWDAMTPEQQAKVQEAADAAADFGRQNQLQKEGELVSFLEG